MTSSGTSWLVAEVLKESQGELTLALFVAFLVASLICYRATNSRNLSSPKRYKNFRRYSNGLECSSSRSTGHQSSLKRPCSVYSCTDNYTWPNSSVPLPSTAHPFCKFDLPSQDRLIKNLGKVQTKRLDDDSSFYASDLAIAQRVTDYRTAQSLPFKYARYDHDCDLVKNKANLGRNTGGNYAIEKNSLLNNLPKSREQRENFFRQSQLQGGSSVGIPSVSCIHKSSCGCEVDLKESCAGFFRHQPYSCSYSANYSHLWSHCRYDEDSPTVGRRSTGGFSETSGLVGLRNIGNTCFMNSVVQCLSNTRCLLEYLVKEGYAGDINTSLSTMKGDLIRAFGNLISEMWTEGDSNRALNTGPFKTQIQKFAPTFTGYQQHDAQEFLRKLLEGLHEDVNRVTVRPRPIHTDIDDNLDDDQKAMESWKRYLRFDDSKIVDMFVGQLKSSLQCSYCSHTSVTFDPFWDLSLPIPSKSGNVRLNQCLDLFTKEEVMDGDERPTCSKCKERRKMTKSFSIQKFPKVLVLHLKRFSPTERWRGKLSCTVEFPVEGLDLSKYASNSRSSSLYNLIGVANHSGTTYSGHYTAFCRHPYSMQWHEYNDSRVTPMPSRRVCSPETYVLFFELCSASKL
ncbi:Peptidase C19 ubiquitin carboxyl-terminal hydrolase [Trinorchestia longiramus]|nr:Peptidase C19 ubiquitin carboxyl-terminal hydrolase [Trinorchestia longiramus]